MFIINDKDLLLVTNSNQWNLYVGRITLRGKIIWSRGLIDLPDYQEIRQAAELFIASLK